MTKPNGPHRVNDENPQEPCASVKSVSILNLGTGEVCEQVVIQPTPYEQRYWAWKEGADIKTVRESAFLVSWSD